MQPIDPARIRVGYFGIHVLQSLAVHEQAALLHDLVHGLPVPRLSPGNVDGLKTHAATRLEELSADGLDPDLQTLETWWGVIGQAVQAQRVDARHELAVQDGTNPLGPSQS